MWDFRLHNKTSIVYRIDPEVTSLSFLFYVENNWHPQKQASRGVLKKRCPKNMKNTHAEM